MLLLEMGWYFEPTSAPSYGRSDSFVRIFVPLFLGYILLLLCIIFGCRYFWNWRKRPGKAKKCFFFSFSFKKYCITNMKSVFQKTEVLEQDYKSTQFQPLGPRHVLSHSKKPQHKPFILTNIV